MKRVFGPHILITAAVVLVGLPPALPSLPAVLVDYPEPKHQLKSSDKKNKRDGRVRRGNIHVTGRSLCACLSGRREGGGRREEEEEEEERERERERREKEGGHIGDNRACR